MHEPHRNARLTTLMHGPVSLCKSWRSDEHDHLSGSGCEHDIADRDANGRSLPALHERVLVLEVTAMTGE